MNRHLRRALKAWKYFDDLAQRPCLDPRSFAEEPAWRCYPAVAAAFPAAPPTPARHANGYGATRK